MNRLAWTPILIAHLALTGCEEKKTATHTEPTPTVFESESVLQLHPTDMVEGSVNWSREAEFLKGLEIFKRLAFMMETDQEKLRDAVRFEFDVLEERIRVIARDDREENAKVISQGFASLYLELRKRSEVEIAQKRLTLLDAELEKERDDYRKHRIELQKRLDEYPKERYGKPDKDGTLEQDRMTYQKALETLKEDSDKGSEAPKDGVLFRKGEKK